MDIIEKNKKKVAVDDNNNVMAFVYQSAWKELEVEDYPEYWAIESIFNEAQQNRFYVKDEVVLQYTEEELKNQPRHIEYLAECRKARYEKETDYLKEKVIEILAKESKDPIVMEWQAKKDKIRGEVK